MTVFVESDAPVFTDPVAIFTDELKKLFKSFRFPRECVVDGSAQHVTVRELLFVTKPLIVGNPAVTLRIINYGQAVFEANEVGEPGYDTRRVKNILKFRRAVESGRVENDVRVDVLPIHMGADNVGVLALEEALGQITPYDVCFLRRNLTGLERLAYVVGNHARSLAPSVLRVLKF